jgi:hypothetical protein
MVFGDYNATDRKESGGSGLLKRLSEPKKSSRKLIIILQILSRLQKSYLKIDDFSLWIRPSSEARRATVINCSLTLV